ncbi:hypothetical protein RFI_16623, partial [Reticulomyxa filosa]
QLTSQPRKSVVHVCVAQNGTHLFMLGGMDNSTKKGTANTQVLNLQTNIWERGTFPGMIQARFDFSCGIDPNTNRLYAIGSKYIINKHNNNKIRCGQVSSDTFTNLIEFIVITDIANEKWHKFKYTLSTPMALYNNAIVPVKANKRRALLSEKETIMTSSSMTDYRRLQGNTDMCFDHRVVMLVVDESCGNEVSESECERLKMHLVDLVSHYDIDNGHTRIGI